MLDPDEQKKKKKCVILGDLYSNPFTFSKKCDVELLGSGALYHHFGSQHLWRILHVEKGEKVLRGEGNVPQAS